VGDLVQVSWALAGVSPRAIVGKHSRRHLMVEGAERPLCGRVIPWDRVHASHEGDCGTCVKRAAALGLLGTMTRDQARKLFMVGYTTGGLPVDEVAEASFDAWWRTRSADGATVISREEAEQAQWWGANLEGVVIVG
jgi:hypothetical protein